MILLKTINYLHPKLVELEDFIIHKWDEWFYLTWLNTEITKPSAEELDNAWVQVQEQERQAKIRQEIADTIIEFKGWKFKIRKKDFAPIIAQFMDVKENSIEPINVLDYYYTPIPFTYQDFLDFKTLVSDTQTQILINNQ